MIRRGPMAMLALLAAIVFGLALSAPAVAQDKGDQDDEVQVQDTQEGEGGSEGSSSEGDSEVSGSGSSDASNGENDLNCGDFDSQDEAQQHYDDQGNVEGGDEDDLDRDQDREACEDYDYGDDDEGAPEGGVDSGAGGTAQPSRAGAATFPVPGAVLMLLGAAGLLARQLRAAR